MGFPVVKVTWIESERGWGQRPDGYSLHLTNADADAYINEAGERETAYWRGQGKSASYVPDEYSRADGRALVDVDEPTYKQLIETSGNGIRFFR